MFMENKIIEILKQVLEAENVTKETSQQNCDKWDSMRHLSLIVELEDAFNVSLEPEEISKMKSVKTIMSVLHNKGL